MREKIHLYYTNDIHSYFENWAKIVGYVKQKRSEHNANHETSWLIDIGDHVDRAKPIAEAFRGKANVALMNEAGYDFATIGNNEGITLDFEELYHLYDDAEFRVAVANLHAKSKADPSWMEPSFTAVTEQGTKIGIIGVTAPFPDFYNLVGWQVEEPKAIVKESVAQLRKTCDIVILLSHLGLPEDREIAKKIPGIDVIIGGHTHHLLEQEEIIQKTIITAAGKQGFSLGEVTLEYDTVQRELLHKQAVATPITDFPSDQKTEEKLAAYMESATHAMHRDAVTLKKPLPVSWFESTPIMEQLTDYLRRWTKADIAFLNAGVLLESFPAGSISYMDIHRICPHPINPAVIPVTGAHLLDIMEAAELDDFITFPLKGFGFRGELIGKMIYSGIDINSGAVYYNGKPLEKERTYKVAMADTFTFGQLLPHLAASDEKQYFMPELLRDLLLDTLKEMN